MPEQRDANRPPHPIIGDTCPPCLEVVTRVHNAQLRTAAHRDDRCDACGARLSPEGYCRCS